MAVAGRNLTGRVAQLGSALPWHGRGPEFKSRHVHHNTIRGGVNATVCLHWRAAFLAAFRRRNFFFRHFQRWFPAFFQARDPRFMRPADLLGVYDAFGRSQELSNSSTLETLGGTSGSLLEGATPV